MCRLCSISYLHFSIYVWTALEAYTSMAQLSVFDMICQQLYSIIAAICHSLFISRFEHFFKFIWK
jgi:hypothetical protein